MKGYLIMPMTTVTVSEEMALLPAALFLTKTGVIIPGAFQD